ncbi:MAG: M56 family metallopeptidase, partial [Planctomycetales bacterium]|nr:M56 family metallopeptidase [Planctomycetales bacterium]
PIVLLPGDLMAGFNAAQREAVIAHELAHVRRGDHLVRWLELVVCTACWWNPLAWFARAQLRVAEEACCDAWVVWTLPDERRNYGRAMLAANEFLTAAAPLPGLAGSALGGNSCKRRIEMVMQQEV